MVLKAAEEEGKIRNAQRRRRRVPGMEKAGRVSEKKEDGH